MVRCLGVFFPSLGFLQFKKMDIYGLQKELRLKRMTSACPVIFQHLQEWNAYLLAKLSFTLSRSGSLSFCQSKWTSFHLWWVLDLLVLSWHVMTLCFHCSSSHQSLEPIWKCSHPFGSQVYRVRWKRGDALRLQNRAVQWSLRGLHCCFSPYFLRGCSLMVPPEASVLAALSAGRTTFLWGVSSSARVRSSWSVAVSQPWHLAPLQG